MSRVLPLVLMVFGVVPVVFAQQPHARFASTAAAVSTPATVKSRVPRQTIAALEKSLDSKILGARLVDPLSLLATTRGVYLDGFGVVFQTQVNLVANAVLSPFKADYTKEELTRLREKKADRIGLLKEVMQEMMLASARDLTSLPPEEAIVVAVNVFYFSWEDSAGAPTQVVMQAPRRALLDARSGNPGALQTALLVKMY